MSHCAVEADLNRYLRQLDRDEARDMAIENRAAELFGRAEYRHYTFANLVEALSETSGEHAAAIESAVRSADLAAVGRTVTQASAAYWFEQAKKQAEIDIDDGCQTCYGSGCRNCEAEEA